VLPFTLLLACGCASPWKRESVYARDGVFLYREHEEADGQRRAKNFAHPIDLPARKAELRLSRLVFVSKPLIKDPVNTYVFTPGEATKLAESASVHLKALSPDERLRFLTTRSAWSDLLTGTSGNSGVVFRTQDGTLHIAFDAIDQGVDDGGGGKAEDVSFPDDPTEYRNAYPLLPFAGSKLHLDVESGRVHPRWLEVNFAALEEARAPPKVAEASAPAPPPVAPAPPPTAAGRPPEAPAARTPQDEARYQELRKKLETLKRLRDDGAVSEQEYTAKYEELMKGL
jgi:hypothetical protein